MMNESIDCLINLMAQFRHKLIHPFEQSHRNAVSRLQYNILRSLREKGPLSVSELAVEINISKQQMTPLINKLLEKGYIQRTINETDRRSSLISLSEKGQDLLNTIKTHIKAILRSRMQQLEDGELECFHESITNLEKLLEKLF